MRRVAAVVVIVTATLVVGPGRMVPASADADTGVVPANGAERSDPRQVGAPLPPPPPVPAERRPARQVGPTLPPPAVPSVSWPGRRQVALTFDDGPGTSTAAVVSALERQGVRATFFVIGQAVGGRAGQLRAMAASGHSIQNHTWSHPYLTRLSDAQVRDQVQRTSSAILAATGRGSRCVRPPYGATSDRVRRVVAETGHAQVLWNVDPSDYLAPSPATIAARVLAQGTGRGLVVELHDGGGNRVNTVAAIPAIVQGLRARGYTFVTLCR